MKKKLLFVLLFMFLFIPVIVTADQPSRYLTQVVTSNVTIGQNFSFEVASSPELESISCIGDGTCQYSSDIWKDIISYSVDGVVKYDSSVLEYVSVSVSQKGGCCYASPEPNVTLGNSNVKISWDSKEGSDWGYHDTILVNFKVKAVPTGNKTTIEFVPTTGTKTSVSLDVNDTLSSNPDAEIKDDVSKDEVSNLDNTNNINDNIMEYVIITLLSILSILVLVLICVMVSRNRKLNRK